MNKNTFGYSIIVSSLLISSFLSLNLFFRQRAEQDKLHISLFPHTIGAWQGSDLSVSEKEYKILETRNLISRDYVNRQNEEINLFIIYSETNRGVFHPPEVCLIGSGVAINDKKTDNINVGKRKILVNKLYLEKGNAREITLYCYKSGNFFTDNYYLQQIHFLFNQLFGKNTGGATIRASIHLKGDESSALTTLKDFMKETIRALENLS